MEGFIAGDTYWYKSEVITRVNGLGSKWESEYTVKTGTTLRNSRVLELLNYRTWLHCALVISLVPDLSNGGSEVRPRNVRLSDVLACGG